MALPALVGALGGAARAAGAGATADGLNRVSFAAHNANALLSQFSRHLAAMASPLTIATGMFRKMEASITGLGHAVGHFVEKVSPAQFKLFQFAADDLTASIGRGLLPAMAFATRVTRGFADVFGAFSGPLRQLLDSVLTPLGNMIPGFVNMMGPVAESFGHLVRGVTAITRPFNTLLTSLARVGGLLGEVSFTVLANALELLVVPLEVAGLLLMDFARAVDDLTGGLVRSVRELLGLKATEGRSVGAAVRQTSMGSVEGFQQKALLAAFMGGMPGDKPEVKTSTYAEKIYLWLLDLPGKVVAELAKLPPEIAAKLGELLKNILPGGSAAAEIAANPGRAPEIVAREGRELGRRIEQTPAGRAALGLVDPLNLLGR